MGKGLQELGFVAAAVCLASSAPAAIAQDSDIVVTAPRDVPPGTEPVSKAVKIGDLDLSTDEGEAEMRKRVNAAIKHICWSHPKPARWQVRQSEECDAFAREGAETQMEAALARARGI